MQDQLKNNWDNTALKGSYGRHYCDIFGGKEGYLLVVPMNAAIFNQIFVAVD